jgi:hypothetical protein
MLHPVTSYGRLMPHDKRTNHQAEASLQHDANPVRDSPWAYRQRCAHNRVALGEQQNGPIPANSNAHENPQATQAKYEIKLLRIMLQPAMVSGTVPSPATTRTPWLPLADSGPQHEPHDAHARISPPGTSLRCSMNHASKATAHEIKIRRVAYFYSAAERRSRGALWPSFAPALIIIDFEL